MSELDLAAYYAEVVKTAGFTKAEAEVKTEETAKVAEEAVVDAEMSDDKVEAIAAVADQFDADKIEFGSEDEKIAAALMIVEGFEAEVEKEAGMKEVAGKGLAKVKELAMKAKAKGKEVADKGKDAVKKNPKAAAAAGGAVTLTGLAALKARKNKDK